MEDNRKRKEKKVEPQKEENKKKIQDGSDGKKMGGKK